MRRIAIVTAALAALCLPATASAADVTDVQGNVLTYTAGDAEVDTVTIADAPQDKLLVTESSSPGGAPGTGCVVADAESVLCNGTNSVKAFALDLDDTITLSAAVVGTLDGGAGDDTVTGGPYNDVVLGGDGTDVLDGRGGFDWIVGGAGDDRIEARDGLIDIIDCGPGDDRATADAFDSVANCEAEPVTDPVLVGDDPSLVGLPLDSTEVVKPPQDAALPKASGPEGDSSGPLMPLPLPISGVGMATPVARVSSDGRAAIELACAPTETAGCRGVIFLDPAGKPASRRAKAKGKKARGKKATGKAKPRAVMARRGRYGRGPFVIAAGKRGRASVRLSASARRALGLTSKGKARGARRGRRVRAKVTVVQKGRRTRRAVVELRS